MSLRGLDSYLGETVRGLPDAELAGRRVALIGSGAEVAALVAPAVQRAAAVKVFLHAPCWVLPTRRPPFPISGARLARSHLHRAVRDPWLRRQLTPLPQDRVPIIRAPGFYRALQAPNCKLITWPIATVSPAGVRTSDGVEHQVDLIVLADGLRYRSPVSSSRGRGAR